MGVSATGVSAVGEGVSADGDSDGVAVGDLSDFGAAAADGVGALDGALDGLAVGDEVGDFEELEFDLLVMPVGIMMELICSTDMLYGWETTDFTKLAPRDEPGMAEPNETPLLVSVTFKKPSWPFASPLD